MDSTRTVVENFLSHLQKRNLEKLVNLFDDQIEWLIPGNTTDIKWLGKRSTKSEARDFFITIWAATEPVSAEMSKIFIDESDVALLGSFSTKMLETNNIVNSVFSIHFIVKGGKITKYTLLEDSYAVSKSLLH